MAATATDPEERARNRRALQIVGFFAALTVLSPVAGLVGNAQADHAASRARAELASALQGVTYGDAA